MSGIWKVENYGFCLVSRLVILVNRTPLGKVCTYMCNFLSYVLAHFTVFSTDCATNASHLEISERRGGESYD